MANQTALRPSFLAPATEQPLLSQCDLPSLPPPIIRLPKVRSTFLTFLIHSTGQPASSLALLAIVPLTPLNININLKFRSSKHPPPLRLRIQTSRLLHHEFPNPTPLSIHPIPLPPLPPLTHPPPPPPT